MMSKADVRVRRVYDEPASHDGTRVLVDRIWPRGLTKARADLAEWCKEVAPSTALRRWYGHDPAKFRRVCQPLPSRSSSSRNEPPFFSTCAIWLDRFATLSTATSTPISARRPCSPICCANDRARSLVP